MSNHQFVRDEKGFLSLKKKAVSEEPVKAPAPVVEPVAEPAPVAKKKTRLY